MRRSTRRLPTTLVSLLLTVLVLPSHVESYEVETHADISGKAYDLTRVNDFLADQLGMPGVKQLARGSFLFRLPLTPREWLRKGSKDEDEAMRFFNHFYDPIHNQGLTAGIRLGERSFEWGLEAPEEFPAQEYSYRDARRYFLLSLTEPDPGARERWLAETFYTLGHVIHLIQDMASPAHTRNAMHAGWQGPFYLGPLSVVEKYLDLDGVRQRLKFDGYPIPREGFTQPRDFWVETDATGALRNGPEARGLSQIVNRNFVSEGTNFTAFQDRNHAVEYPNPVLKPADCYDEEVSTQDAEARPVAGLVTFCPNSFTDPNTGKLETNPRMTTFSLFSRDLRERGKTVPGGEFSLNALNAWSIGQLTIPRAVGYSAGLLDYFFRGKLEVSREPDPASGLPSLRIVNRSPEPLGERGEFTLYRDDQDGNRTPVTGATLTLQAAVPKDNDDAPLRLPLPADLPEAGLTLVYQGPLGLEPGAVIGQVLREVVVEQVYRDWATNEWILRTKDGLYVLPLEAVAGLTAPLERVTWGDRDNQLVAITDPTGADPYEALLFELDRPLGSVAVPLSGQATEDGYPFVALRLIQRVPLYEVFEALDLNTTVEFSGRLEFAQYMPSYTVTTTCVDTDPDEERDLYSCTSTTGGDTLGPAVQTWTGTVNAQCSLRLDPLHHTAVTWNPPQFGWSLREVRADRAGRLVAVVRIAGGSIPEEDRPELPTLLEVNSNGSLEKTSRAVGFDGDVFFLDFWVAVVVDLTSRRLVAKSSADQIRIHQTHRVVEPSGYWWSPVAAHSVLVYREGTRNGERSESWAPGYTGIALGTDPPTRVGLTIPDRRGMRLDFAAGELRESLAALGVGTLESPGPPADCFNKVGYRTDPDETVVLLRVPCEVWQPLTAIGWPSWMRWTGPMPGKLRLHVGADSGYYGDQVGGWLLDWSLEGDTGHLTYTEISEELHYPFTGNATGVLASDWYADTWLWIPWLGAAREVPGMEDYWPEDFVALDPDYVYGIETGRFHMLLPGLPAEAGPVPLVLGEEDEGEYHVVGR